jgi:hypothetical protein
MSYIQTAITGILSIILVYVAINYTTLNKELALWRTEALNNARMYKLADSTATRRAIEIKSLQTSNALLNKTIKEQEESIRSLTVINGKLQKELVWLKTNPDTVWIESAGELSPVQRFDMVLHPFYINGYFQTNPPYNILFEKLRADVSMEVILTEDKRQSWKAYVFSKDSSLAITDISTSVNPYVPAFIDNLKFSAGMYAGLNRLGISSGVMYKQHILKLNLDNLGGSLGYEYVFNIH